MTIVYWRWCQIYPEGTHYSMMSFTVVLGNLYVKECALSWC